MPVMIDSYQHRTGEHCASTALRNILAHRGLDLSEGMIFGLASGLGFAYLRDDSLSPTRIFHGRTMTLESDLGPNTGIDLTDRPEPDDDRAWQILRERIDDGEPVMLSTDTFYLGYHNTTSHFPGHRCVVVGYDDASRTVFIADRKFSDYQRCSFDELRRSRNSPDYPMRCENQWGDLGADVGFGGSLGEACSAALRRNATEMLQPTSDLTAGIPAMRELASDFPSWSELDDWSWAARFGYQVVIKRGAAGSFFRPLFRDFLVEATPHLPKIGELALASRMDSIAGRWRDLAALLKEQSERDDCAPELFVQSGAVMSELADAEQSLFEDALTATGDSA